MPPPTAAAPSDDLEVNLDLSSGEHSRRREPADASSAPYLVRASAAPQRAERRSALTDEDKQFLDRAFQSIADRKAELLAESREVRRPAPPRRDGHARGQDSDPPRRAQGARGPNRPHLRDLVGARARAVVGRGPAQRERRRDPGPQDAAGRSHPPPQRIPEHAGREGARARPADRRPAAAEVHRREGGHRGRLGQGKGDQRAPQGEVGARGGARAAAPPSSTRPRRPASSSRRSTSSPPSSSR